MLAPDLGRRRMVVELHPQALQQLCGSVTVEAAVGDAALVERFQVLIEVARVVRVPAVELGDDTEVDEPVGLNGLSEIARGVGGHTATNLGDPLELAPPLRFSLRRRHLLGPVGVTVGEEDGRVRRDIHRLELLSSGQRLRIQPNVEALDRGGDLGLEIEEASSEDLAVADSVAGSALLHELGEDPGRERPMPFLRKQTEDSVAERAALPERDHLALVALDVLGGNAVAGHGSAVQDPEIVGTVAGDLGVGRRGLGLVAAFADDQLVVADVDGLVGYYVVKGLRPQHRLRVLADVLAVELGQQHRPFDRDRRMGVEAPLSQSLHPIVHGEPPTVTLRSCLASFSATVRRASASGGCMSTGYPVSSRRDRLPSATPW